MEKLKGVLTKWDEVRGFGFISMRDEFGTRLSFFLHHSGIKHIEGGGLPALGAEVLFNVEKNERGPLAVDAEIASYAARRIARALTDGGAR
jgi:cold shock CspA family protein